jgi:ABC-type nitrate/sulfonate/bicarbonate transport system substrate-binding protein
MALNLPAYSIVTVPTIASFQDLKGKTMAVDSARTGYALLLKKILAQKGLKVGDYALKEVGGTAQRIEALKSGAAVAALVNQPSDLKLFSEGFKSLGGTSDYVPYFQGSVAMTKRSWAAKNSDTLIRYIRAYVAASDWLFEPKNREEAIEILLRSVKRFDRAQANATYENGLRKVFIPKAAVNLDGLRQVIELFWEAEGLKPPLPSPEKYVDLSYHAKAMGSR